MWGVIARVIESARKEGQLIDINMLPGILDGSPLRLRALDIPAFKKGGMTKVVRDVFLPPDPSLVVTPIAGDHTLMMNKFMAKDPHFLLIRNKFASQMDALSRSDFLAAAKCMRLLRNYDDGTPSNMIGWFNGGVLSGGTQPHKHMQFIPLRQQNGALTLNEHYPTGIPLSLPSDKFPFPHTRVELPKDAKNSDENLGDGLYSAYKAALSQMGIDPEHRIDMSEVPEEEKLMVCGMVGDDVVGEIAKDAAVRGPSYNLIMTEEAIVVIARKVEEPMEGISVNTLGFLGLLFVKRKENFKTLLEQHADPRDLLTSVVKY